jgi:hypothetical protein
MGIIDATLYYATMLYDALRWETSGWVERESHVMIGESHVMIDGGHGTTKLRDRILWPAT